MRNFENQNMEQEIYKTGATDPSQKRGGLVAGLLVAVILLAGVSSILGLMNIKLFQLLQEENSVSFTAQTQPTSEPADADAGKLKIGLTVAGISELDQRYFRLPAGALIREVEAKSCAEKAGLAVGDIIQTVNGTAVFDEQSLLQALQNCQAGDAVEMQFYRYREEKQFVTTMILEESQVG